ncbi:MAG TPA: DMT family transporter [Streptosporangiaceae bacterium]|jgi:drug/metabolite transporter (DMT)-like permease
MLAVLLALAAAAGFGGSDFTAGLGARTASVIRVTILAEAAATLLSLLIVPWVSPRGPSLASAGWGAAGGISGVAAAMALYLGFRHAAFSVASTLSAVSSAALSVVAGLLLGERPAGLSLAGIALALPAIAAVSASPQRPKPAGEAGAESRGPRATPAGHGTTGRHLTGVGYGLAAGAGFALYYFCLNEAGSDSGLWPVLIATLAGLVEAAVIGAATGQLGLPSGRALGLAAATGVAGVTGTAAFFAATHNGELAATAVITSLYPAVTILLARVLLAERLTPVRLAGLCLAAASVGLIAAGGTG